jgi:hypothetical protein
VPRARSAITTRPITTSPFHALRVEQAQIAQQSRLVACQQVTGVTDQVLAIGFQVGAVLLDHEHLGTQRKQLIESGGIEFTVV